LSRSELALTASPPRPQGRERFPTARRRGHESIRVHSYGQRPSVDEIPDPDVTGPLDVHCENSKFPGIDTAGEMAQYLLTNARAVVKPAASLEPAAGLALADAGLTSLTWTEPSC
jgi:hypothetical protein